MNTIISIFETIRNTYQNPILGTRLILGVLFMVFVLSVYEFAVYRLVSRRAFYNRSFHISIAVLPFFISTIILCLQSNIVITLGTIGALAIIRFRTAVKDPVDMIYLLWSIHIGIACGCQLYEVAVLTSLAVTIVLLGMEHIHIGKKPFVLVLHCQPSKEENILQKIGECTKKYRVKSRNFTPDGLDLIVELSVKAPKILSDRMLEAGLDKFSLIEYDSEDIL